jgi:Family of unknown function (DUF5906)
VNQQITRVSEDLSVTVHLNGRVKCQAVAMRVESESAGEEVLAADELNPILQKDREAFVKMIPSLKDRRDVFDLLTDIGAEVVTLRAKQSKSNPAMGSDADPIDREIADLNKQHAVLLGGSGGILREVSRADGFRGVDVISQAQFRLNEAPRQLLVGSRTVAAADLWLKSLDRRQYEGLCFVPGADGPQSYYNLWKGFAVEPDAKASCQRLLDHLKENVCSGSEDLYTWLVAWFAALVQRPREKYGTAVALIGPQGTGKTLPGQSFGRLFGPHYHLVADPRFVVGRFNSHLAGTLLLQADEGFWAGDRTAEGKLKDLITGARHQIEFKGREPITVDNYVRLLVTSNQEWVVPAAMDQRRFAVLDVSSARANDHDYFAQIIAELEAGGYGALLHHLQTRDLTGINLRVPPPTSALLRQKTQSANPEEAWWLDVLHEGALPADGGSGVAPCKALYTDYTEHAERRRVSRCVSLETFGHFLRRIAPGVARVRMTVARDIQRQWCYAFPRLMDCRKAFEKIAGQVIEWQIERDRSGEPVSWN